MDRIWAFLLGSLTVGASLVASLCLLIWLHGVRHANKHKLMWRQLKQLALADVLYAVFVLGDLTLNALSTENVRVFTRQHALLVRSCQALGMGFSTGFYTSLSVETHLVVCSAAAIFRWTSTLRILRKWLSMAWTLGFVLALLDIFMLGVTWRYKHGCIGQEADTVGVSCIAICVMLSLLSYFGSLIKGCATTRVVRIRIWHRTQYYVLVVIVFCLPNVYRMATEDNIVRSRPSFHAFALALFNLRGLANTLVYAIQTRYVRRVLSRHGQAEKRGENGSFHVCLGAVDVVEVAPTAAAALERSEWETRMLEESLPTSQAVGSNSVMTESAVGSFGGSAVLPCATFSAARSLPDDVLLSCFEAAAAREPTLGRAPWHQQPAFRVPRRAA